MRSKKNIAAVILAGGRSSRMGVLKPLLSLGAKTVIETAINAFRKAEIDDIIVVLGHEAGKIIPLLENNEIRWVINDDYDRGMFSSVQVGVRSLAGDCRAFFLSPADVPLIRVDTLERLINAFQSEERDVYHPCYRQRRGHPPLIAATLIPSILAYKEAGGLRALLARYQETSLDVERDDPGILLDLDSPEDYKRAKSRHGH
jgi:molybdenum cofactor cytidylyltransferase